MQWVRGCFVAGGLVIVDWMISAWFGSSGVQYIQALEAFVKCNLQSSIPIGPKVIPFGGSYLESYKVIPKETTMGPMGS